MKAPLYAIIALGMFLVTAVVLLIFANPDTHPSTLTVVALIVTTIPSIVASLFAERASRDIRNGTVKQKAKEGSLQALQEAGITDAVQNGNQHSELYSQALLKLLERSESKEAPNGGQTV